MKYIKLFESNNDEKEELADLLPDDYIDEYYDRNYSVSIDDALYGVNIWDYVDDDTYLQEYIDGYVQNTDMSELEHLNIEDYEKFIKYHLLKKIPDNIKRYLDKARKKLDLDKNFTYRQIFDNIDISKKKLIKLIVDSGFEGEFIEEYYNEMYRNYSARDLCEEMYGEKYCDDRENAYKLMQNYLNEDDIIKAYKDNESEEYKKECVARQIDTDIDIQEKVFETNPEKSVFLLFDVVDASKISVCDSYEYQKVYMEQSILDLKEENLTDDLNEIDNEIAEKLNDLDDKFGLHEDIEKEYDKFMWMVNAKKYNL